MTPSQSQEHKQLKVLSFNAWGLAFISKDRPPRIRALAEYLASSTYDVVCLQECWIYKDFEIIREEVLQNLPFSRFFHTGALGSGLAIFTRYPIISAQALPYSLSGTPQKFIDGDFFVNKAAGNVVILHPLLGEVEIWNTHMHAAGENPPDTRQAHRIAQSWELANQIRSGAAKGRYVLCMGDFNSQPFSVPIAIMRSHAEMNDSFLDTHPHANDPPPAGISPESALTSLGMSCDSPLNSWSFGKKIAPKIQAQGGKRLDYIFYRQPEVAKRRPLIWGYRDEGKMGEDGDGEGLEEGKSIAQSVRKAPILRCVKSEIVLTEKVPGQAFSYSDHFGLFSTFSVDAPDSTSTRRSTVASTTTSSSPLIPLLSESEPPSASFPHEPPRSPTSPTSPRISTSGSQTSESSIIRTAVGTLRSYNTLSQKTATNHLRLSGLAVVLLVALAIGSGWQPKKYIQPIFTVVAGVLGGAAVTFFYLGFLWGRWEEGLLREVTEEMELELRVVEMEERASARGSR